MPGPDPLPALLAELDALPRRNTPAVRRLRCRWSRRLAPLPARGLLRLADRLVARGAWGRFLAYELVAHHPGAREALGPREITRLARGMSDWSAVDMFACYLAGPAWRARQLSSGLIHRWAGSRDVWWRRAALVSTVPLNVRAQGGSGDPVRTLAVCRLLVGDREDLVVKALSWALRCLSAWDPAGVRRFLAWHQSDLAPRVLREVRHKLETGLKNPGRSA